MQTESISDEKGVHAAHVAKLRALFDARPMLLVTWEELEALVGRNYQQRISDLNFAMGSEWGQVVNVPRFKCVGVTKDGREKLKRLTGDYRFTPYTPLGRDASTEQSGQRTLAFVPESFR